MTILGKKQMSEEDIKLNYITPVILDGWKGHVTMETKITDFDFICYVAYGRKPLTRKERANNVKKKDFFSKYSVEAQAVLSILLDKYMNQGITEVEDIKVLSLADFADFGKPAKIVKLFGGKVQYEAAIKELEANIYELEVS